MRKHPEVQNERRVFHIHWDDFIKHDAPPEQGWELQSLVCMCGPGQLLPPCCGEGELQNRSLICTPELHSEEQGDHRDHADQPPFTESIQMTFFF